MARCFFGPMRAFFTWTSAPQWVRDGEPEARRSSRIFWMRRATSSALDSRLFSTSAPVDARNTIVLPARQRHTVGLDLNQAIGILNDFDVFVHEAP